MSVEFSNAYQEVLLENIDSILKQNFMFQTQLKLVEKEANIKTELQAKLDDVTVRYQQALEQVGQAEQYKAQASSNDAIVQEKSRIQSALNDTMRELGVTKSELEKSQSEVAELKTRIKELEKLVPALPKATKKTTEIGRAHV